MDLATILGLIIGFATVFTVCIVDGGNVAELFSAPAALLLIIAGSLSATTTSFPLSSIKQLPKLIALATKENHFDAEGAIEILAKMADKARREGLLALEEESKKIKDPFLQKGIMLVVDGTDPNQVKAILETQIEHMEERHAGGYGMFTAAGGFAPTFGIIGTVMGLINVLKQLDNPSTLGKAIASAFLATLWGLLIANVFYLPVGAKLRAKSEEEIAYRRLLLEGILALQAGENPRIVREKLNAFMPPKVVARMEAASADSAKKGKAEA
jgi:chemotaxis protein MotA